MKNPTRENLLDQMLEPICVDFDLPGLEELSLDCCRAIEPGDPARSLLYHVLASPAVAPVGIPGSQYLRFKQIEMVENSVYAASCPSLPELRQKAGGPLAIVVFAYEYAPAIDTVHRRHADFCFSRTGISRVGNTEPHFVRKSRGFLPNSFRAKAVHVVPSRFGAFIAVQRKGNKKTIGPERFQNGDENRDFWVPMHKLFRGQDCIEGLDLDVRIQSHHVNEKIRRVHLALRNEGVFTGWSDDELNAPPFRITESLAFFDESEGLLKPFPHPLVEPARTPNGGYVTFRVPPNHKRLQASLWFQDDLTARHWPEFVHVKHAVVDGKVVYLPHDTSVPITKRVEIGGYDALNFVDYTADGWVEAVCPSLLTEIPTRLAAYSVIAQPDFFPKVRQQDLMEWWETRVSPDLKAGLWSDVETLPTPLSGSRLPGNLVLKGAQFDSRDTTLSAVISCDRGPGQQRHLLARRIERESTLSYRATNLFQPGWDTSEDFHRDLNSLGGTFHLANYGLGSPFPEDTLVCAASGAYWPGAVPDATRFFPPHVYPSITPFIDNDSGWDGLELPEELPNGTLRYKAFAYVDYVKLANDNEIDYAAFAHTELHDYGYRTLTMARVYQALRVQGRDQRSKYAILSFRAATHKELLALSHSTGQPLGTLLTYRVVMIQVTLSPVAAPKRPDSVIVTPDSKEVIFANPACVIRWDSNQNAWKIQQP